MAIDERTINHHTAYVMDRGGKQRLFQIRDLNFCQWGRTRDEISQATIKLTSSKTDAQADNLQKIEPGRHELCIYRGKERVWEGPINLATFTRSGLVLDAYDVMRYAYRTAMRLAYSNAYPNVAFVTDRAYAILTTELSRKEFLGYNITSFIQNHHNATDAKTSRATLPYQSTVFDEIDKLAADSGIDYTVVGRAIHLWDTSMPMMGITRTVTENDFLGEVFVSVYGANLATQSAVTDGQGLVQVAGSVDPFYGEWEVVSAPYDQSDGAAPPTAAEMLAQAQRNLSGRNPTPLQIRVPDNSGINPKGILKISDLVPGVYIPVRATLNIREVKQVQKLKTMQVTETPQNEAVTVSMYPASQPDLATP